MVDAFKRLKCLNCSFDLAGEGRGISARILNPPPTPISLWIDKMAYTKWRMIDKAKIEGFCRRKGPGSESNCRHRMQESKANE
ncbi:hypothetical protein HNY73_013793 [Argiope bruennichi]|uniref:Uncharacterized protein n=1 Tax=Argiope bruennichi TaxID=94029 RepID=A0A8T0EM15_ARGBR|nr:hypothetical protein HNY73_013793 [Argiope bruennichi]